MHEDFFIPACLIPENEWRIAFKCMLQISLFTPETPRAAFRKRKYCVAGGAASVAITRPLNRQSESGAGVSQKRPADDDDVFLLSSYLSPPHNISICVCVLPVCLSLSLLSHTSLPAPPPHLPCSLAPLSSCFSGFLNCDISAAAPPSSSSSSSYCSCSSSSSARAMCGRSN